MYYRILLFCCCLIAFSACNTGDSAKKAPQKTKTAQTAQTTTSSTATNEELHPILQEILPTCDKVEFVFYVEGMSMSTETTSKQAINSFYSFVSPETAPKKKCPFEGGAVFRSGDDIVLEMDFVLKPECRSIRVTANKKTYLQKLTDQGYTYLMQFAKFRPGDGTPSAK